MKPINPNRPKVSLRRVTDPGMRCEIKSFALNRGKEAQPMAYKYVMAALESLYSDKPTAID